MESPNLQNPNGPRLTNLDLVVPFLYVPRLHTQTYTPRPRILGPYFFSFSRDHREEKVKLNVTLVKRMKIGVSEGGVNVKGPAPLNIIDWEWGSEV